MLGAGRGIFRPIFGVVQTGKGNSIYFLALRLVQGEFEYRGKVIERC